MRHRRQVQDQVGRSAKCRMHGHRIAHGCIGQDVAHRHAARFERQRGARRTAAHVQPDGMSRRRQCRMRQRHPQRFRDHLRSRRGAQELAPPPGSGARAAQILGSRFQRDLTVREPRANALHAARILALFGQQRHSARRQHARQIAHGCQRHHHGGQPLVASGHPDDARRVGSERIRRRKTMAASLR